MRITDAPPRRHDRGTSIHLRRSLEYLVVLSEGREVQPVVAGAGSARRKGRRVAIVERAGRGPERLFQSIAHAGRRAARAPHEDLRVLPVGARVGYRLPRAIQALSPAGPLIVGAIALGGAAFTVRVPGPVESVTDSGSSALA